MTKRFKMGLIVSCLSFASLSAGIGAFIGVSTNSIYRSSDNKISSNGDRVVIKGVNESATAKISKVNDPSRQTSVRNTLATDTPTTNGGKIRIQIEDNLSKYGNLTFIDSDSSNAVDEHIVVTTPGKEVRLQININDGYDFANLSIKHTYQVNNEDSSNESTTVTKTVEWNDITNSNAKAGIKTFSFIMPEIISFDNGSINSKDLLTFETYFSEKKDSTLDTSLPGVIDTDNSYIYKLTENTKLDDNKDIQNSLKAEFEKMGKIAKDTNQDVDFVIMLNNYTLEVGVYHIPEGVNVTFLNNKNDTAHPNSKIVSMECCNKSFLYTLDTVAIWRSASFDADIYITSY